MNFIKADQEEEQEKRTKWFLKNLNKAYENHPTADIVGKYQLLANGKVRNDQGVEMNYSEVM